LDLARRSIDIDDTAAEQLQLIEPLLCGSLAVCLLNPQKFARDFIKFTRQPVRTQGKAKTAATLDLVML
jgi:hypothetical protein